MEKYPGARGLLGGKEGPFAQTLRDFLDNPPRLPLPATSGRDWPMFGGSPDRSGRTAGISSGLNVLRPWKSTIPAATEPRHPELPVGPPARPPFSNPVIVNGVVFVTDGRDLLGFDLLTGKMEVSIELLNGRDAFLKVTDPSPSLAAAGDRLYVRVGPGGIKQGDTTAIVCMKMSTEADGRQSTQGTLATNATDR